MNLSPFLLLDGNRAEAMAFCKVCLGGKLKGDGAGSSDQIALA